MKLTVEQLRRIVLQEMAGNPMSGVMSAYEDLMAAQGSGETSEIYRAATELAQYASMIAQHAERG